MKKIVIIAVVGLGFISCNKEHLCYDPQLERKAALMLCTADCPGFVACNGETYCNECEAARDGFGAE
ncbi:MAG: hypothetical protein MK078_02780 [Crocinitomicaceae bacterium]|nr:hypothetical protein [Crocinitomicaceae bacterium]